MLIKIDQLAERSSVSRWTVMAWIRGGHVPTPSLIGGFVRWPQGLLQRWLDEGCPAGPPPDESECVRIRKLDSQELRADLGRRYKQFTSQGE